jgi:hypothetical protein
MNSQQGNEPTRRRALKIFGLAGTASMAGCLGGGNSEGDSTPTASAEEKILGEGPDGYPDADLATILDEGQGFTYDHQGRQYNFTLREASREEATIHVEVVIPDEVGQNKEGIDPVSNFGREVKADTAFSVDNYTDCFYGGRKEEAYLVAVGPDYVIESDFEG